MTNHQVESDQKWMRLALDIAQTGLGQVEPNPMVGCILVESSGNELARGFHARFGEAHAERVALGQCVEVEQLPGSTAYVTLEPCCHHGKTPPCADALIEARIRRVVIGCLDPNPLVSGRGAERLRQSGIDVITGCLTAEAERLIAPFAKRQMTGMPWVIGKWAMTLDGKIATRTGSSKWISNEASRQEVQELRSRVDAILVGSGTALADNPRLIARRTDSAAAASTRSPNDSDFPKRKALRVVADSRLRLPLDYHLAQHTEEYPTICLATTSAEPDRVQALRAAGLIVYLSEETDIAARLRDQLQYLSREHSVTNLLCEGGGELLGALNDAALLDQLEVFVGPKLFGGHNATPPVLGQGIEKVDDASEWVLDHCQQFHNDIHLSYRRG